MNRILTTTRDNIMTANNVFQKVRFVGFCEIPQIGPYERGQKNAELKNIKNILTLQSYKIIKIFFIFHKNKIF